MSETLEHTQETETAERPFLVREVAVSAEVLDGRNLEIRVVPFGEVAMVADPPDFKPYREQFMPGVFANQERAANRILLNFEHSQDLTGIVGHGVELREDEQGYTGVFRMHDDAASEKARTLILEGVVQGGSAEFLPLRSIRTRSGVVQRIKGHLDKLSLTRKPAYKGAAVLALREEPEIVIDEDLFPVDLNPELVERCRRLGIALPQRYQAHPEETDTPAEAGTSESAPATTDNTDTEE
jgi:HK97 family phage prohead protease